MNARLTLAILVIALAIAIGANASDVRTVTGESVYYGTRDESMAQCKRMALQQARIDALAREFGTTVSNVILQQATHQTEEALLLSETEVKGEWIADEGEPQYQVSLDDDCPVVRCKVKGKARPVSNEAAEFKAAVMRNGTDPQRDATTSFRSGDQMLLSFQAPADGYVAVILADAAHTAYMLLPYPTSGKPSQPVKGKRRYTFFDDSVRYDDWQQSPDAMIMGTDSDSGEWNRLYVIYSPNRFNLPVTSAAGSQQISSMPMEEFTRWLLKARRTDPQMGLQVFNIEITPPHVF